MKDDKTLEAIVKRCQGECYIGIVGPVPKIWQTIAVFDTKTPIFE